MGFLSNLFGFRWSLYIVQNGNQLVYAMHEHSAVGMLGYVMGYYRKGGKPVEPWSLHLNYNKKHQSIQLLPEHFTHDGENLTPAITQKIKAIDPDWLVKNAEPVFMEAATKKRIKINDFAASFDLQAIIDNPDKPREKTFYSVMDEVFGRR